MKAFASEQGVRIGDKVFYNVKTRKVSVEEYKTLKKDMEIVDDSGFAYIYFSEEKYEVMIAHLDQNHSFQEIVLYKGIS